MKVKIATYNINGIRAALKKNFIQWLLATEFDVLCLQEIKADESQINLDLFRDIGYHIHLFPADKKGYSGVAILSKEEPNHIEPGMGISKYDTEGRVIRTDFDKFSVMSVYMPSGASKPERQVFKLEWLADFHRYISHLTEILPNLVIGGDFNICHAAIDIHDPFSLDGYPGFTAEERLWLSRFIKMGFVDSFRHLNPLVREYSWWSYMSAARSKNLGWRIDYLFLPESMKDNLIRVRHLTEAGFSDHCPVVAEFKF